jgi:hypothetical protein
MRGSPIKLKRSGFFALATQTLADPISGTDGTTPCQGLLTEENRLSL